MFIDDKNKNLFRYEIGFFMSFLDSIKILKGRIIVSYLESSNLQINGSNSVTITGAKKVKSP